MEQSEDSFSEDFEMNEEDVKQQTNFNEIFQMRQNKLDSKEAIQKSITNVVKAFKKENHLSLNEILRAFYQEQEQNSLVFFLHDLLLMRTLSNDWSELKNSKQFSLMLLVVDDFINSVNILKKTDYAIALLILEQVNILFEHHHVSGRNNLILKIIRALIDSHQKINEFDEIIDEGYLLDQCKQIKNYEIFMFYLLDQIELYCQYVTKVPNIEIILKPIIDELLTPLNLPAKTQSKLNQLLEHIYDITEVSKIKTTMDVIPDLPVILIKPQTPRIKEEFLTGYNPNKKKDTVEGEHKKLKKKQKLMRKQLLKEISNDQEFINKLKHQEQLHQKEQGKKGYKNFIKQMDEAQLEFKKLKTQQLNVKRIKKQSKRLAGNKVK